MYVFSEVYFHPRPIFSVFFCQKEVREMCMVYGCKRNVSTLVHVQIGKRAQENHKQRKRRRKEDVLEGKKGKDCERSERYLCLLYFLKSLSFISYVTA